MNKKNMSCAQPEGKPGSSKPVHSHKYPGSSVLAENILNASTDIFYIYDLVRQRIEYQNKGFEIALGYTVPELKKMGKKLLPSILHPEDYKTFQETILPKYNELIGAETMEHEFRVLRKNKEWCWLHARESILSRKPDGSAEKVFGVAHDITGRKQSDTALRESEERFRMLFNRVPIGYQSLDAEGNFIEVNETCLETLGYSREEVIGKWFGNFLAPTSIEAFRERFPVFKNQGTMQSEFEMIRKDGTQIFIAFNGRIGHTPAGDFKQTHCVLQDITERKQAEEALRESEERYRSMVQILPDGVIIHSEGKVIFANEAARRIMHAENIDQMIGVSVIGFVHPDFREIAMQRIGKSLAENSPAGPLEETFITFDGNPVQVSVTATPYMYMGKPSMLTVFTDISGRKKTEDALRESEEIFSMFMEYNPVYVFFKDHNTRPVRLSKNFEQLLGMPMQNMIGKTMDELFPSELAKAMVEDDLNVIRNGNPVKVVEELNGRIFETTKFPIFRPGAPNYLAGFTIDITERTIAEKELETSMNLLRNIIDSSNDAIYVKDLNQRIIVCNSAYSRALNKPVEALLGNTDLENGWDPELINGNESQGIKGFEAEDQAALEGILVHLNCVNIIIDKEIRLFDTLKLPLRNREGNITGMFGISRDITERQQVEEKISQMNQELEQRVTERTAQLTEANRELETFAYSVSHDLRAPLRAIDGFSQLLTETYFHILDDQGKNYIERIRSGTRNMAKLIDDLLILSRVSRSEMSIQTVSLSKIASEISNEISRNEPGRNVKFEITPGLVTKGDAILLRAAMDNLLRNAWKFTSKHPFATIKFGLSENQGRQAYFIQDDGAGFDMAYEHKLFGPFQRLHAASEFPGTGIGLATVQRIIHRHGGTVWAEGNIEKGATFYFTLGNTVK